MKGSELLRLVLLNLNQNKFKTIMTSIGIVVGAATIVMVIAIGRGSQMDVEEQFSNLNAGAIDVSYEYEGEDTSSQGAGGFMGGMQNMMNQMGNMMGNFMGGFGGKASSQDGSSQSSDSQSGFAGRDSMPDFAGSMPEGDVSQEAGGTMPWDNAAGQDASGGMPGSDGSQDSFGAAGDNSSSDTAGSSGKGDASMPGAAEETGQDAGGDSAGAEGETEGSSTSGETESETEESLVADRMNQEDIILSAEDVEDINAYVSGITGATISYTTKTSIEGGNLTSAQTYTIAGVKENYLSLSNLTMGEGDFIEAENEESKDRVCVLGASIAKELFGTAADAYESTLYIDDREYTIIGVISATGTVSAGITPDDTIFVPYQTGIKYITGESISPTITVISENVNAVSSIEDAVDTVLKENYTNVEFTYSDAGSKMEAAESSSRILTTLLSAMAAIVFLVGGIGIMNVLFVSVKERTNEIGILKALGASKATILFEFLIESAAISLIGGVLGVGISFAITPLIEYYGMRVEANLTAWLAALGFALLTGTLFGIYPAAKAAKLVPIDALNAE